jgi:hypothetical protein
LPKNILRSAICTVLLSLLAARLRETDVTVAAESFLTLRGRFARTLLELAENFGQDIWSGRIVIHQKIRQSDLAALAGIARETISRILNDWKRRKLVSQLSGYYGLENKVQLERQAKRWIFPGWPNPCEAQRDLDDADASAHPCEAISAALGVLLVRAVGWSKRIAPRAALLWTRARARWSAQLHRASTAATAAPIAE